MTRFVAIVAAALVLAPAAAACRTHPSQAELEGQVGEPLKPAGGLHDPLCPRKRAFHIELRSSDLLACSRPVAFVPVRTLAGHDVAIAVAADEVRTGEPRDPLEYADRVGPDRGEVTEQHVPVGAAARANVFEYRIERDRVSMDVREDRETHRRTISAPPGR